VVFQQIFKKIIIYERKMHSNIKTWFFATRMIETDNKTAKKTTTGLYKTQCLIENCMIGSNTQSSIF
jgi:hypothetical protein